MCSENERILGFVSFKENYTTDVISQHDLPNIYVSTLVVSEAARGRGITTYMYNYLFNELYDEANVFTRTWSTNVAHIKILGKFAFEEISRIENHRGNGIDTVYYAKRR